MTDVSVVRADTEFGSNKQHAEVVHTDSAHLSYRLNLKRMILPARSAEIESSKSDAPPVWLSAAEPFEGTIIPLRHPFISSTGETKAEVQEEGGQRGRKEWGARAWRESTGGECSGATCFSRLLKTFHRVSAASTQAFGTMPEKIVQVTRQSPSFSASDCLLSILTHFAAVERWTLYLVIRIEWQCGYQVHLMGMDCETQPANTL